MKGYYIYVRSWLNHKYKACINSNLTIILLTVTNVSFHLSVRITYFRSPWDVGRSREAISNQFFFAQHVLLQVCVKHFLW